GWGGGGAGGVRGGGGGRDPGRRVDAGYVGVGRRRGMPAPLPARASRLRHGLGRPPRPGGGLALRSALRAVEALRAGRPPVARGGRPPAPRPPIAPPAVTPDPGPPPAAPPRRSRPAPRAPPGRGRPRAPGPGRSTWAREPRCSRAISRHTKSPSPVPRPTDLVV